MRNSHLRIWFLASGVWKQSATIGLRTTHGSATQWPMDSLKHVFNFFQLRHVVGDSQLIHRSILCIQRIAWRGHPAKDRNVICHVSVVHRLNFICCLAGVLFFGLRLDLTLPLLPLPWCRWNGWAISWRIGAPWKMPSYANTCIEALTETPSGSSSSPCSHVLVKLASWE